MADGSLATTAGKAVFFASPNFDPINPNTSELSGWYFFENITALKAHPTLPLVAVGTDEGFLAIVSQHSGSKLATTLAHDGPIYDLEWSPDGTTLFSGGLKPALATYQVVYE